MPDKWKRGLASHSLLSCHANVHPSDHWALHLKTILGKGTHWKNPSPRHPLVLHAPPKMYLLSLGELSAQVVKGSAVHVSSLAMSTTHRTHWILKVDTCWKDDAITLQLSQLCISRVCISWCICLLNYNIPVREGSNRLTREHSWRIESAIFFTL